MGLISVMFSIESQMTAPSQALSLCLLWLHSCRIRKHPCKWSFRSWLGKLATRPLFSTAGLIGKEIQLEEAGSNLPEVKVKLAQLWPTFWDPMDFKVCGILQSRILEWVAFPFSSRSSQPRNGPGSPALQAILYQLSYQGRSLTRLLLDLSQKMYYMKHFVKNCAFLQQWVGKPGK